MSYKTQRHIKNTFGIVPEIRPDKRMTYEVENKTIKIKGYSGIPQIIPITESTSLIPETGKGITGIVRGSLGFGNVIIKNSSGEHKIEGLKNIKAFMDAVYAEINPNYVKSESDENEDETSKNQTTYNTDVILSEKIMFPTIPRILYKVLSKNKVTSKYSLFDWKVKDGDFVQQGEVICEINVIPIKDKSKEDKNALLVASIKAPLNGIINIEGKEVSKWPNFQSLDEIDDISKVVSINRQNIWFSFFKSTEYENYPLIGTSRLIANDAYKDLVYYLFFMDNGITENLKATNANLITLSENESDESPEKKYVYLQAFADYDPTITKINNTNN